MDIKEINPLRPGCTPEQEEIDREVSQLEDRLIRLKRRRNTLSFISRLPTEILLWIFHLVRGPSQILIGDTLPWIRRLTHICFTWRTLALGDPSLWTNLCFDTPEMLSEMIKRSGEVKPLTISYDSNDISSNRRNRDTALYLITLPSAFHQIHRLQHLELVITEIDLGFASETLELMSNVNAPLLQIFILTFISRTGALRVPPSLFRGWTHLETLELRFCAFDWSSLVDFGRSNPNLQRLVVSHCRDKLPTPDVTVEDVLRNMTQLRHLELDSIMKYRSPSHPVGPAISFNCLQTLRIAGYVGEWLHLFEHINSINPSVRLDLMMNYHLLSPSNQDVLSELAHFLSRIWSNRLPSPPMNDYYKPLLGIVLNRWPNNGLDDSIRSRATRLRLELHHTLFDIQNNTSDCPCTINLSGVGDMPSYMLKRKAALAWKLLEHMDLTTVEHLYVHTPMDTDLWVQASKEMPELNTVQYIVDDVQSLVQALQMEWTPGQDASTPGDTKSYPTVLTQVNSFDLGVEADVWESAQFSNLVKYFKARNQMGMKCEKFTIWPGSSFFLRLLQSRLAQYVDVVHCSQLSLGKDVEEE